MMKGIKTAAALLVAAAVLSGTSGMSAFAQTDSPAYSAETSKQQNEWITEPWINSRYLDWPFERPHGEAKFGEVKFTYGTSPEGPFSEERPIEVGKYYMLASVDETDDYEGISAVEEFDVLKHIYLEYPGWYLREYTGQPQTIEPFYFGDDCTVSYGMENGTYDLSQPPEFTEPGQYTVYFIVENEAGAVHRDRYCFEICPADETEVNEDYMYYSAVEYDGKSHVCGEPAHDVIGDYTIKYSLDGENYDLDEAPSFTEPGFYYVYWCIYNDGRTISSYSELEIFDNRPWTGRKLGDVDADDDISANDALAALRMSTGIDAANRILTAVSEIDFDDSITANDALNILRYSAGLDAAGPIGTIV